MTVMAVDLGLSRTGLAVSDESGSFAFPKGVIFEKDEQALITKICENAAQYGAKRIVVGLPKNMDGSLGERAETCERIAGEIEKRSGIETMLFDERLTTNAANVYLNINNVRGKKRKNTVDAVAATLILEDYLKFIKN